MRKWVSGGVCDRKTNHHSIQHRRLIFSLSSAGTFCLCLRMVALWHMVHCYSVCRLLPRRSLSVSSRVGVKYMLFPYFVYGAWSGHAVCVAHRRNRYRYTILIWWFAINFDMHEANHKISAQENSACLHLSHCPPSCPVWEIWPPNRLTGSDAHRPG